MRDDLAVDLVGRARTVDDSHARAAAVLRLGQEIYLPAVGGCDPRQEVEEAGKAVSPVADFSYDYQDLLFTPIEASK